MVFYISDCKAVIIHEDIVPSVMSCKPDVIASTVCIPYSQCITVCASTMCLCTKPPCISTLTLLQVSPCYIILMLHKCYLASNCHSADSHEVTIVFTV